MNRHRVLLAVAGLLVSGFTACGGGGSQPGNTTPPPPSTFKETSPDASGTIETFSPTQVDKSNPFFTQLGSNNRTCNTCHVASDGWSITPVNLQQRFQSTQGTDPIFRVLDGANCPSDDVSTPSAAAAAYSQLLNFGLIRMSLPVPANAEFSIISITDPYQCPETTATNPALYRRPLPSTNLKFLNGIMWDGREPDLKTQAKDATTVHAQPSTPPTDAQLQQIVTLETSLFTAQSVDTRPETSPRRARMAARYFSRLNPSLPGSTPGRPLLPMHLLSTPAGRTPAARMRRRSSLWRGEKCCSILFPILISVVPGFNDVPGPNGHHGHLHDLP